MSAHRRSNAHFSEYNGFFLSSSTSTTTTKATTTKVKSGKAIIKEIFTPVKVTNIGSDTELCEWSVNDYNSKKFNELKNSANINAIKNINKAAVLASSAEITEKSDNIYKVTLKNASGEVLDVYEISPITGADEDSNNAEVNLPHCSCSTHNDYSWLSYC
ncbi:MAG: hypothetical protein K2I00_09840 [Ruminococcus sp.]|nr:hypothetical protein [Ruminococcus sp.]